MSYYISISHRKGTPYTPPIDALSNHELEPWKLSPVVRIYILTPTYAIYKYKVMYTKKVKVLGIGRRDILQKKNYRCEKRGSDQVMINKKAWSLTTFLKSNTLSVREKPLL